MFILLALTISPFNKWIVKDETIRYPFELSYPQIPRTTHPNNSTKIAVCSGCKSNPDGRLSYKLASIPACIEHVPCAKRKYLSPVYLHTSSGRSANANPFVEYRSLMGGPNGILQKPKIADSLFGYTGCFLTTNRLVRTW